MSLETEGHDLADDACHGKETKQFKRTGKSWCFWWVRVITSNTVCLLITNVYILVYPIYHIQIYFQCHCKWSEWCRNPVSFQKFSKSTPFYSSVMLWPDQFQDKYTIVSDISLFRPLFGIISCGLCWVLAFRMNNVPSSFSMHPKHVDLEPAIDP